MWGSKYWNILPALLFGTVFDVHPNYEHTQDIYNIWQISLPDCLHPKTSSNNFQTYQYTYYIMNIFRLI